MPSVILMSNSFLGVFVLVGLVLTILLLIFIFSSLTKSKETFKAVDGTSFSRKIDLNEYEFLYARFKCLYEETVSSNQNNKNEKLGLNKRFVQQIKADGFLNLNSLITNKEQFKKLAELFDVSEMSNT